MPHSQLPFQPLSSGLLWGFYSAHITGMVLLTLLFLTTVLYLNRHATVPTFFLVLALNSFFASMLAWTGNARVAEPSFEVCLTCALGFLSGTVAQGAAAFALILKIWSVIVDYRFTDSPIWTPFLVATPWLAAVPTFIYALVWGLRNRSRVVRTDTYCMFLNLDIHYGAVFAADGFLILTLLFALWSVIVYQLKHRHVKMRRRVDLPLFARVLVFCLLALMTVIITFNNYRVGRVQPGSNIAIASISVAVFFIFGSQRDVLRTWRLIKPGHTTPSTTVASFSTKSRSTPFHPSNPLRSYEGRPVDGIRVSRVVLVDEELHCPTYVGGGGLKAYHTWDDDWGSEHFEEIGDGGAPMYELKSVAAKKSVETEVGRAV